MTRTAKPPTDRRDVGKVRSLPRYLPVLRILAASAAVGLLAGAITLVLDINPPDADIKYDWLTAWGALNDSAHKGVIELADSVGVQVHVNHAPGTEPPFLHPRTPGAILLSLPLLLIPYDLLFAFSVAVTTALIVGGVLWAARSTSSPPFVFLIAIAMVSAPAYLALRYAGQAALVASFAILAWVLRSAGRDKSGGVFLAIAGTLKLFPLVLVVPALLARRFRFVVVGLGTLFVLNLLGLLLPGVELAGSVETLTSASETWLGLIGNASLVALFSDIGLSGLSGPVLAVLIGVALLYAAWRLRGTVITKDPLPWLVAALVVLPLSWISYDLVLVPFVVVLMGSRNPIARIWALSLWAVWAAYVVFAVGLDSTFGDVGYLYLAARLMILAAWALSWVVWQSEGSAAQPAEGENEGDRGLVESSWKTV